MNSDLKVHFYLRHNEVKNDGEIPIMGRITIGKSMAQFRAKCCVQASLWDVPSGRAAGKSKAATELNRALDKINLSIHSYHQELLAKKENVTALEVKNAFQGIASDRYRTNYRTFKIRLSLGTQLLQRTLRRCYQCNVSRSSI